MPDPLDALRRLDSAVQGGPMLPPEEVRRRGDRIRRRTRALVAAGGAAAVAAVAVPVLALGGGDDGGDVQPATDHSLTASDLMGDAETQYTPLEETDGSDWFTTDTWSGDGQAAFHPCATESLSGLGAGTVLQRAFELRGSDGSVARDAWMTEAVARFESPEAAESAYAAIAGWVVDCESAFPEADRSAVRGPTTVDPGIDGRAEVYFSTFTPVAEEIDPYGDSGYLMETGLVVTGDRVAVITSVIVGQDYDFLDGTPVERMIPAAAELLLPGGDGPTQPTPTDGAPDAGESSSTERPDAGATAIPDEFPLAAGWPDDDAAEPGTDLGLTGPSRSLPAVDLETPCGEPVPDPAHLDRLGARWENVEDGRVRQLTLYGTQAEAEAAVSAAVEAHRACPVAPVRDDGYVTETEVRQVGTGDEAWALLESDTFDGAPSTFGETTVLVRVGAAVLVVVHTGHSGNPQGDPRGVVDAVVGQAEQVIGAMSELSG